MILKIFLSIKLLYTLYFLYHNHKFLKNYFHKGLLNDNRVNYFSAKQSIDKLFSLYLKSSNFVYFVLLVFCFEITIFLIITNTYKRYSETFFNQLITLFKNPVLSPRFESSLFFIKQNVDIERILLMYDKVYWHGVFTLNNVSTPKIFALIKDNKVEYEEKEFNWKNTDCIIKKRIGTHGTFVKKYNECLLGKLPNGEFIIQEQVKSIGENGHYRIVTFLDSNTQFAKVFLIYYLYTNKNDVLATNQKQGSILKKIELYEANSNEHLRNSVFRLRELHKNIFKNTFIIGWDVMITETNYFVLEGNAFPSTIFRNDTEYFYEAYRLMKLIEI